MAKIKFTVEFDKYVWETMSETEREGWVEDVRTGIEAHAYLCEEEVI